MHGKVKILIIGSSLLFSVVIRIRMGDPTALVQLSKKFGVEPESEAPKLLTSAVHMGLNVVGVRC